MGFHRDSARQYAGAEDLQAVVDLVDDPRRQQAEAVIAARYDEIVTLVENIRTTDPLVATQLRNLVDRFDYDGLRALLSEQ